jgi:predicted ester cyclase
MKKLISIVIAVLLCGGLYAWYGQAENVQIRHKATMKRFETMINTNDKQLAEELISSEASFFTPASPTPLYGGSGYLSVVDFMREGFSDVQWKLEDMVAENNVVAVRWTLTGTHDGEFMGVAPTGTKIKTTVMNFYFFDDNGKIINDIAADGMIGILRPLGLSR